ncbi:hypothetical protein Plim_0962 [Planctopirus limnophila DSM 3776]|uniref:Uncharacterized protein n=1 Tax=Planctopirus limnophila (strain ATCC 43296 / DSM 3776 / IFAM 1008 / Mu 290) TaxID=521674 RepID=D5ST38_PLAL2|nr:hypothetical protein Plim_0962 [Planctopirus limnophila DSM 3776]
MCFPLLTINNIRKSGMHILSYGHRKKSGTSAFGFCQNHEFNRSFAAFHWMHFSEKRFPVVQRYAFGHPVRNVILPRSSRRARRLGVECGVGGALLARVLVGCAKP